MTASDRLTGRVNRYIADLLRVEDARVMPHARLREDLGAGPLDLMRLAVAIECDLGLEPVPWSKPEESWATCADVHGFALRAAKVPA